MIDDEFLSRHNFVLTHTTIIRERGPTFERVATTPVAPVVYTWLTPHPQEAGRFLCRYVGKASGGVDRRLREHQGGFANSRTGAKNKELIVAVLAQGLELHVYARVCGKVDALGIAVSSVAAEEQALAALGQPEWNRAAFPQIYEGNDAEPVEAGVGAGRTAPVLVDAGDIIDEGGDLTAFIDSLSADRRRRFEQLAAFLINRYPQAAQKLSRGYTGQPAGYNNVPMFVFSLLTQAGIALDWFARIPLKDEPRAPLTIIFHPQLRAPDLPPGNFVAGQKGTWRPLDIDDLLARPNFYLR